MSFQRSGNSIFSVSRPMAPPGLPHPDTLLADSQLIAHTNVPGSYRVVMEQLREDQTIRFPWGWNVDQWVAIEQFQDGFPTWDSHIFWGKYQMGCGKVIQVEEQRQLLFYAQYKFLQSLPTLYLNSLCDPPAGAVFIPAPRTIPPDQHIPLGHPIEMGSYGQGVGTAPVGEQLPCTPVPEFQAVPHPMSRMGQHQVDELLRLAYQNGHLEREPAFVYQCTSEYSHLCNRVMPKTTFIRLNQRFVLPEGFGHDYQGIILNGQDQYAQMSSDTNALTANSSSVTAPIISEPSFAPSASTNGLADTQGQLPIQNSKSDNSMQTTQSSSSSSKLLSIEEIVRELSTAASISSVSLAESVTQGSHLDETQSSASVSQEVDKVVQRMEELRNDDSELREELIKLPQLLCAYAKEHGTIRKQYLATYKFPDRFPEIFKDVCFYVLENKTLKWENSQEKATASLEKIMEYNRTEKLHRFYFLWDLFQLYAVFPVSLIQDLLYFETIVDNRRDYFGIQQSQYFDSLFKIAAPATVSDPSVESSVLTADVAELFRSLLKRYVTSQALIRNFVLNKIKTPAQLGLEGYSLSAALDWSSQAQSISEKRQSYKDDYQKKYFQEAYEKYRSILGQSNDPSHVAQFKLGLELLAGHSSDILFFDAQKLRKDTTGLPEEAIGTVLIQYFLSIFAVPQGKNKN